MSLRPCPRGDAPSARVRPDQVSAGWEDSVATGNESAWRHGTVRPTQAAVGTENPPWALISRPSPARVSPAAYVALSAPRKHLPLLQMVRRESKGLPRAGAGIPSAGRASSGPPAPAPTARLARRRGCPSPPCPPHPYPAKRRVCSPGTAHWARPHWSSPRHLRAVTVLCK